MTASKFVKSDASVWCVRSRKKAESNLNVVVKKMAGDASLDSSVQTKKGGSDKNFLLRRHKEVGYSTYSLGRRSVGS